MEVKYTSMYGMIIKRCPGLCEYWYHGKLVASGSSISSSDPLEKPTSSDWDYCKYIRGRVFRG